MITEVRFSQLPAEILLASCLINAKHLPAQRPVADETTDR